MTMREYHEWVEANVENEEIKDKAREELDKMDKKNADRKAKPSKTQLENKPIIEKIATLLTSEPMVASDIAKAYNEGLPEEEHISTSKAQACVKQVEGVKDTDVKIPKVGTRKGYFL